MKYSYTASGLLALAGSTATLAAAVPKGAHHIVDVHRDLDALQRAVDAHTKPHSKRDATDPTSLDYGSYWFANITAGGLPAQVLLDSGSADLWLVSPTASSDATDGVTTWDPTQAQGVTAMDGSTFSIGYGQGGNGVSGPVYSGEVCIGEACTTMAVGSASTDQGLGNFPRSGILGLAFQGGNSVSPNKQPTFMEAIAPSLASPIYVTKFTPDSSSQIAFGAQPFATSGDAQTVTVDTSDSAPYPYSWSVTGVQYSVNGNSLGAFDVVFDTGGPMSSAAEDIVRGYYGTIQGANDVNGDASSWTVPCGTALPDLNLDFGGATATIPGSRFYNGNTATTGDCQTWFVKENSATRGVIGDPFFAQHVITFNQNDGTISWQDQA